MVKGKFYYLGSDDVTQRDYEFTYDDEWLLESPKGRNFDLLKIAYDLSLSASLRAYVLNFYDQLGYSYSAEIDYEKEGLNVLAGAEVKDSVYYPAAVVDGKYYYNSIGYAIGYKTYKDHTLMLVTIRGGHYGSEWGGNFNIGKGQDVEGFKLAADQVIEGIKTTLKNIDIVGDIKILTSGYSRAAATSNLVAARLTQGAIEEIKPENVFGFAFECPRNTRDKEAFSEKYNNIISVSNPNDAIPRLAESVFGYRRYGQTYYYPGVENCNDFYERYARMKETEKTIVPFQFMPVINGAFIENNFVNDFAFVIKDLDNYVQKYQNTLVKAAAVFLGGAKEEVTEPEFYLLGELQNGIYLVNPVNTIRMAKMLGSEPKMIFKISFNSIVFQNHAMELNLSWLNSLDGYDQFCSKYYKLLYINSSQDVTVYGSDMNELAKVTNQSVENKENKVFIDYDNNGQLVVLVNPDAKFTIKANNSSDLDISYARFDMQLGLKDKVVNYKGPKGESEIVINSGADTNPEITVNNENIEPEKIYNEGEFELISVRIESEKPGVATGGGYFTIGEYAQVKILPEFAAEFDGWYCDGQCVSKDLNYKFPVKESVVLTPKFTR